MSTMEASEYVGGMFKNTNKDTRTATVMSFLYLYC